jgi:hypothetical protein
VLIASRYGLEVAIRITWLERRQLPMSLQHATTLCQR